mmetsp:Transcript_35422/g.82159  ORF Transcript_35422/g.82159 Transcript_35422/m.82159 type:complete len:109 (-) Transcript_35422:613-939(-)
MKSAATSAMKEISNFFKKLQEDEKFYFDHAWNNGIKYLTPTFYLTIKIHKDPWFTRPVTSCRGILLNIYSKCIDRHFKSISEHDPTRLQDSDNLADALHQLGTLPSHI